MWQTINFLGYVSCQGSEANGSCPHFLQQKILKAVISEATPQGSAPAYKFAINSTIVQHVVPTAQLNKPTGTPAAEKEGTSKKGQAGRRGMHSATGGYWNEQTDGMWSFKYDGEDKGLDVVLMLIWIAI
jgi:hypothetical protein